ncbi:hypothetical protein VTJ04DRAFT_557 [Mycothermus thermophilus]|uniref:uncharacterized protein n=1 Tax=Humicola insolens TaxID=85995 RepID=UPI00374362B6
MPKPCIQLQVEWPVEDRTFLGPVVFNFHTPWHRYPPRARAGDRESGPLQDGQGKWLPISKTSRSVRKKSPAVTRNSKHP